VRRQTLFDRNVDHNRFRRGRDRLEYPLQLHQIRHRHEVSPVMSRSTVPWVVGIPLVVFLGLAISYSAPPIHDRDQHYELVKLLVDSLSEVDQNYVRELDPEGRRKLVEDMINGGLERLDPHSGFMNSQEYKQFERKSRGKFGGIGIQVTLDRTTGNLVVSSPLAGSPAYNAGILPGDQILKVDGKPLDPLHDNATIELIQGEPGTSITLTVVHEGQTKPVDITMVRAIIEVETVYGYRRKPDNPKEWDYVIDPVKKIAYVRLIEFDEPTAPALKAVLEQMQAEGLRGLILDLRGNPGGLLTSAVEIADFFLTEGRIVSTRGRRQQERVYDAKAGGTYLEPPNEHPIVVLVDRASASASEIVAAALQDHDRAVIVGERSYGKGSVQNLFSMEDGATAMKLTTQSYWRPSGKNIHRFPDSKETDDWGVRPTPGFEVSMSDSERIAFLEARRKHDILAGKNGNGKAEESKPFTDPALERALTYLRSKLD
jgi:carboxyl-terminal processing protease